MERDTGVGAWENRGWERYRRWDKKGGKQNFQGRGSE